MNTRYFKGVFIKSLILLVFAHIPHFLLFVGLEIIPIVFWVAVVENIPLLFIDAEDLGWFEISAFGINDYTWQGFIISLLCKYVVFFIFILVFDMFFRRAPSKVK